MDNLITQAEHARRCDVSRKSVTVWKDRGQLVLVNGMVDFDASYKGERWHSSAKKAHQDADAPAPRSAASPRTGSAARKLPPSAPVTLTRAEIVHRLLALDWTRPFDGSPAALKARSTVLPPRSVWLSRIPACATPPTGRGCSFETGP